jgi:hypothetical protein
MPNENNTLLNMLASFMQPTQAVSTDVVEPTMTGHDSINNIMNEYTMSQMPEPTIVGGGGLGSLVDMMSPMKAAALIPAGSDKAIDMLNAYTKYRRGLKAGKERTKRYVKVWTDNPGRVDVKMADKHLKRNQEQLNKLVEESMIHQSVNQAMKQYNMFGAARPGTEQFIQKLLKSLNR